METGYNNYGARFYSSDLGIFLSVDPLADKYPEVSPYMYCLGNPLKYIDPDGRSPWPLLLTYNGFSRRHENNFGASRPNGRTHKGVDFNHTGGGNTDFGAPILSTHDGYVSRIVKIGKGDKDAGGTRVSITSADGTVSTSYMHLSEVGNLKVGDKVFENQEIGRMGGSGFGKENAYTSHLHYELILNGEKVSPIGADGNPMDPQLLLNSNEVFDRPSQPAASTSPVAQKSKSMWGSIWTTFKEIWKGNFNYNPNQ